MILQDLLKSVYIFLWLWLNFFLVAAEIRFLVQWFLNINPYFEPIFTIWTITNPIFLFGRNLYPKFFGMELAPIINFKILAYVNNILESLVFS